MPAVEAVKAPVPSALRKFLASLFSPLVLRYAVPALGLIVVAAIGLFVSRSKQNENRSVAQNVDLPTAKPYVAQSSPEPGVQTYSYDSRTKEQPAAGKAAPSTSGAQGNETGAAAAPPPAPVVTDQTARDELAKKEDQQPTPADVPAATAPKPAAEAREQKAKVEREETSQARVASEPPAEKSKDADTVRVEDRKAAAEVEPVRSVPVPGSAGTFSSGVGGIAANKRQRDDAGADKENKNAETKTVAGRRFRKQDGIWIDTAYSSSRNVVNVARGSEQYRALIADEPGIKTIAEQLDGEIVVVWKGHTYRIR